MTISAGDGCRFTMAAAAAIATTVAKILASET